MIYLDTNVIIYAIENHPKYGNACKKILLDVQNKKTEACCSMLVLAEVINVLQRINKILETRGNLDVRKNMDAILSMPIVWFDMGFPVLRRASEYDYEVAGADYIHIATMEINSVRKIISADKEFDKVNAVTRIDPLKCGE